MFYFKIFLNYLSIIIVILPWISYKITKSIKIYLFWAQVFALIPGVLGVFLRRAYYRLVFPYVSWECEIGFGTFFSQPWGIIEKNVYIGPYCILGKVIIGEGSLIASRVSIPSGKRQHKRLPNGKITPADPAKFQTIKIGKFVWIGEGSVIMDDIGEGSTIAAGSVVIKTIPPFCIAGGNPARILRKYNLKN